MDTKEKPATHTPGPWVVGSNVTAGKKLEGCSIFAEKIKDQIGWMRFDLDEENHANARLIAAAPELLEQCKHLEKIIRCRLPEMDADIELAKVREVLAKVDGGEG
tara:strand:+ start:1718 stop:2032 length:315 start_codon:yes stop_codon:yes gene_type:complete